jgi:hypothetical protein
MNNFFLPLFGEPVSLAYFFVVCVNHEKRWFQATIIVVVCFLRDERNFDPITQWVEQLVQCRRLAH